MQDDKEKSMRDESDVYYRLGMRLNENQVKMLLVEPFFQILEQFYTSEQAELGAKFPIGAFTVGELTETYDQDAESLTEMLETMADDGLIFVIKGKDGVRKYTLTQFVPGVVEYQLMRGRDTPHDRKVAKMLRDFMEGEMRTLMEPILKDPELMKQMMPEAPARIITVEGLLPDTTEVYSYERLSELIDKETDFSAATCYCRHQKYLLDDPCKIEGLPQHSCLLVGEAADYASDRGFGNKITKEEAHAIIELSEKAGLMHNVGNYSDRAFFVCNCCGCCCEFLDTAKRAQNNAVLDYANFIVKADTETCSGCGDCIDRCQMEALSLVDEVISINENMCFGCGNCVPVCPTESLTMVRRRKLQPPEAKERLSQMGLE
jgi:NAD-dependent dihydropyrimidine dehydrogenase PreA subunit